MRRLGDLGLAGGAATASVVLLVGECTDCGASSFWGGGLAVAGLTVATAIILARLSRSDTLQLWGDVLVALAALAGFVVIGCGAALGLGPCAACVAFWSCVGVLFLMVSARRGAVARTAPFVVLAGMLFLGTAYASEGMRWGLRSVLPPIRHEGPGLTAGARFPYVASTPVVAVATRCTPCAQLNLRQAVTELRSRGFCVTLYVPEQRQGLAESFRDCVLMRASLAVYRALEMTSTGTPRLFFVSEGIVVASKTPQEVLR